MRYHDIVPEDMLNGAGIRVVLFLSGCDHHCEECHNPQTWDFESGVQFDEESYQELRIELQKEYVSGLTLSGGDPLNPKNILDVHLLCKRVKSEFPDKNIWCYTGYLYENLVTFASTHKSYQELMYVVEPLIDVIVDGRYVQKLKDINYPYAGSTNQRVIDVKKSFEYQEPILWLQP